MYPRIYCAPDEGAAAGGAASAAGTAPAEKTYTQADIDRMMGQRLASKEKELAAVKAEVESSKAKLAEFDSLTTRLQALEDEKLSAAEKARKDAERAAKAIADREAALAKERDEWRGKAETAERRRVEANVSREVGDALAAAKALPGVLKHAIPAFRSEVEIDTDEDGRITAVRFDGVARKDLADAAGAWLTANPHFQQHPGGGSGAQKPNGAGLSGRPLHEVDSQSLIREGLRGVLAK